MRGKAETGRERAEVGRVVDLCAGIQAASGDGAMEGLVVVSRAKAALLLDCSAKTIDRYAADGLIDKRNFGHGPRITLSSIRGLIENTTTTRKT